MKNFILKTLSKDKEIITDLEGYEVDEKIRSISTRFVINYEDFKNDKKRYFDYVNFMISKFAEYLKEERSTPATLLNFKNKELLKDIKKNGIIVKIGEVVVGVNLIVVNKKKVSSHLNKDTTTALIEASSVTEDIDEALSLFKKNKRAYNNLVSTINVGRNVPQYFRFELIGVI